MSATLLPDRAELDRFVAVLFRHADPAGFLALRIFGGAHGQLLRKEFVPLGASDRAEVVEAMARTAAQMDVVAPVFAPPVATFREAGHARVSDLLEGVAITVECDERPTASLATLRATLGPPTLIVESGGLWLDKTTGEVEPKAHAHWRLAAPARTARELNDLRAARRLACDLVGADATAVPIVHPLRWPGSWHRKAEPRLARIVEENETEVDLADALARLGAVADGDFVRRPDKVAEPTASNPDKRADPADVAAALQAIPNRDWPWDEWSKFGMAVFAATAGDWVDGFLPFAAWSAKSDKHDPDATEERWAHWEGSPPKDLGAGTLFRLARKFETAWVQPSRRCDPSKWFEAVEEPLFGSEGGSRDKAPKHSAHQLVTAADLQGMAFAPVRYVVPGYLAEGCTILAGAPKIGKSWMVYEWAIAKATGGICLGNIVTPDAEDVLYLALEDNLRRLKGRMERLLRSGGEWPSRLTFATTWPRANEGGLDKIREWARGVARPRLVIIDVLQAFRPPVTPRDNAYAADYNAVRVLTDLASELGVALVAVLHTRKARDQVDPFDRVSGTLGLSGAADTALILDRDGNGVTLYGRGRDIPEIESAVSFDKETCRWFVQGRAAEVHQSDARKAVTDVLLVTSEPLSPVTIAEATGQTRGSTKTLLFRMFSKGEVLKTGKGFYVHPSRSDLLKPS